MKFLRRPEEEGIDMGDKELRPCRYSRITKQEDGSWMSEERRGLFHFWAQQSMMNGCVARPVAVVEESDGRVYEIQVCELKRFQFLDK